MGLTLKPLPPPSAPVPYMTASLSQSLSAVLRPRSHPMITTFRSQVNGPIRTLDPIEVRFDHDHGVAGLDKPIGHVVRHSPVAVPGSWEPGFSARMRSWRRCPSPTLPLVPESRHGPLPPGCFGRGSRTTRCPRTRSSSRTAPAKCTGTTRCLSDSPRWLPTPTATRP